MKTCSRRPPPTTHCPVYRRVRRAWSTSGGVSGRREVGRVALERRAASQGLAKPRRAEWSGMKVAPLRLALNVHCALSNQMSDSGPRYPQML